MNTPVVFGKTLVEKRRSQREVDESHITRVWMFVHGEQVFSVREYKDGQWQAIENGEPFYRAPHDIGGFKNSCEEASRDLEKAIEWRITDHRRNIVELEEIVRGEFDETILGR